MSKQNFTFLLGIAISVLLVACSAGSLPASPIVPTDVPTRDPAATPPPVESMQTSSGYDCRQIADISVEECQALVAFYEGTGGDQWQENPGWLANKTACTWYGVICQGGHVIELQLDSNQLVGSLPPEIGNLTHLKHLYLSANQLSDPLPPEIVNLLKLETAHLGGNEFSSIPVEIADLENLIYLGLGGSQLRGEIPVWLGQLSKLQELRLNDNQLTGSIPAELGNLANLHTLDLSHNQLTGLIPAELGDLHNLNWLDLSHNQLNGPIPAELENATVLYWLNLSYNQLTGAVPEGVAQATREDLRLWGNLLDGTVPASEEPFTTAEFHGVQFDFPSSLAESVWPEIGMPLPLSDGGPGWAVRPEHLRFTFADRTKADAFRFGWVGSIGHPQILIYPAQQFSTMSEIAKGELETLDTLLDARPPAPEGEIPVLPLINAAQVFHAQVKYVDFQNGSGVRFITNYSQEVVGRLTKENVFYTFQGLTWDGKYYVAAFFPITSPGLRDEMLDEPWDVAQTRLAEDIQHLDSLSSEAFEPDLDVFDSILESLVVELP